MIQAKRSFVKCGDCTGSHELAILSYATVCLHPSVSLNNEKICCEFSEHKIAVCEKTAGLRSGNSTCLKVLVPVEIFQFSDMHYETERYRDSTHGLKGIMDDCASYAMCPHDRLKLVQLARGPELHRSKLSSLNFNMCMISTED